MTNNISIERYDQLIKAETKLEAILRLAESEQGYVSAETIKMIIDDDYIKKGVSQ